MLKKPAIDPSAFVAPNAAVLGDVTLGAGCSVFFGAVVRAEYDAITVGEHTNIQDNCVLHVDEGFPMHIGRDVTVGHGAILHGCTVGDNSLIGMGAIVLNGAVIGRNCIVGAGALVPQNAVIPDGSLAVGFPAKVRRAVTEEEIAANADSAAGYVEEAQVYRAELGK
ncbi:MAG: gamma carbonic anhydrase family protein [Ruminococcaceae bacterium]|jgi:carbonic anhydrase/acetyltransferase-like protein (isoleucine patch superfamily)|nr:gamma carbonic anhydrase family protein [Oscillospiraceae bacterium]